MPLIDDARKVAETILADHTGVESMASSWDAAGTAALVINLKPDCDLPNVKRRLGNLGVPVIYQIIEDRRLAAH